MSLKRYTSSMNPTFPVPKDVDVIDPDAKIEERGSKVAVKTRARWISVFPSQLRPIADFIEEHGKAVKVTWYEDTNASGNRVTLARCAVA